MPVAMKPAGIRAALSMSRKKKSVIRMRTSLPDKDVFDGIVLHVTRSIVVFRQIADLELDGVVFLPFGKISSVRVGKFEEATGKVLGFNGELKKLQKLPWIKKISTFRELMKVLSRDNFWPVVEMNHKGESALYIGPILQTTTRWFYLYCYDATGKWEKGYTLRYNEISKVEFYDRYSHHFNNYMDTLPPPKEYRERKK